MTEYCPACPYAKWQAEKDSTEPQLDCDPPMGMCPAEFRMELSLETE